MLSASLLLVYLLLAALAACQIVEVLRHGSIFAPLREWAERKADDPESWLQLLGELLSCPFCLSHWAGLLVCIPVALSLWVHPVFSLPLIWLAAVRLANLLNDTLHWYSRSPDPYAQQNKKLSSREPDEVVEAHVAVDDEDDWGDIEDADAEVMVAESPPAASQAGH